MTERDNDSNSPNHVPLCINGMIPVLSKLSDPHVLQALASQLLFLRTINTYLFLFIKIR